MFVLAQCFQENPSLKEVTRSKLSMLNFELPCDADHQKRKVYLISITINFLKYFSFYNHASIVLRFISFKYSVNSFIYLSTQASQVMDDKR